VPSSAPGTPLATLWRLTWNEDRVACVVYRAKDGLRLTLETAEATILSEPFSLQPRMLARSAALRTALKRHGWRDLPE
jgi:hypothetical protein